MPVPFPGVTLWVMWYLRLGTTEPTGPHSTEQIQAAIAAGNVSSQSTVMAVDDGVWRPIDSVPAFAAARPKGAGVSPGNQVIGYAIILVASSLVMWWAYSDLTKPGPPTAKEAVLASWKRHDERLDGDKSTEALAATFRTIKAELLKANDPAAVEDAVRENESQFRSRAARRLNAESYAKGYRNATLVPSNDPTHCMVWGSQWTGDLKTAESMREIGFQFVECPGKTWVL